VRERRGNDWKVDLEERLPLEAAVGAALSEHPVFVPLSSSTASCDRLDFQLVGPGDRLIEIELKAKRQSYRGWGSLAPNVPESELFILDELAFRKVVDAGRYAVLLVRDRPNLRWLAWTMGDLLLVDKVRANRQLAVAGNPVKAKLLIDMRQAPMVESSLRSILDHVGCAIEGVDARWTDIGPWPSPTTSEVA
jgi:hypothetical protein